MPEINIRARLVKETKNKLRYAEVDEEGNDIDIREAKLGTMYFVKDIFGGSKPQMIDVKLVLTESA